MPDNPNATFKFFHYDPSLAAAVIFIIVFLITTLGHVFQLFKTRTWIMVPLVVGGFFEVIGYIARAQACKQTPDWTLGPFIVNTILVLVAPALFAATVYMELGRIIELTGLQRYSVIRLRWLTKIFVAGDVLSFLMQSGGGGIMAGKTASAIEMGQHIVVGGLIVQILFFGFFVVVAALFNMRIKKDPTSEVSLQNIPWKRQMYALYLASGLILVRSLFRVVEYLQGNDGSLLGHEVFLYIFDAVLMVGVMVLLNIVHPSEIYTLLRRVRVSGRGSELNSVTHIHESVKASGQEPGTRVFHR